MNALRHMPLLLLFGSSLVIACSGNLGDEGQTSVAGVGGTDPGTNAGGTMTSDGTGGSSLGTGGGTAAQPVDCSAISTTAGWNLCDSTPDSCMAVFDDSAGCSALCAAAGLVCSEVWDNVEEDGACAADTAGPQLNCDSPSGHQSGYCVCVRGDAPSGTGGADGSGGSDDMDATGGSPGAGGSNPDDGCPSDLVGWAAHNGSGLSTTTGGGNATPVRPTTVDQLLSYALDDQPRVIEIEGTFNAPSIRFSSNKTLVGIGNNATINGGLRIYGSNLENRIENIIVRNVRINAATSSGDNDEDGISLRYAHHVWIDHCEIWDAADGNIDIVRGSDFITVSWTKFWYSNNPPANNHRFCNLIGNGDDNGAEDEGRLNVTMHHNWWAERVHERMPRVRFGRVHVFNNYFSSTGNNYAVRAGRNAKLLVENNYFHGIKDPQVFNNATDQGTAHITVNGNTYDGTTGTQATGGGGVAFTNPPYPHNMDTPAVARQLVESCAGPRP